jgi:porphobilinogen synthase
MAFPQTRLRRLRASAGLRRMSRGIRLHADDLILPVFVHDNDPSTVEDIGAMPGVKRWGLKRLPEFLKEAQAAGVNSCILFGLPNDRSPQGGNAMDSDGIFARAIAAAKAAVPEMVVISDVCFCGFTEHGHCGVWHDGRLDNDATLEILGQQAVTHARAGVDMVAPSDMTDGKIGAIRAALDEAGFVDLPIMSYATKFASAFYGPFREAAGNKPGEGGHRKSYQMDPANLDEALHEALQDLEEGADVLMVKPGLAFLDIIRLLKDQVPVPVAAYSVSGEYAMIEAAAANGWIDRDAVMMETLTSFRRAGADLILTYHAIDAAKLIAQGFGQ